MSQLTLTLDDNLLQAAQAYAQRQGQELDVLVAHLLADAVRPAPSKSTDRASMSTEQQLAIVRELAGSLKAPIDFDYKKELEEGLAEKYGV